MPGLSNYSAQQALDYFTGQVIVAALPAVYLALFTTAPTSNAGTGGTEVTGGSYARVQVAGTATTNGTTANGNPTLNFASVPAWITAGMSVRDVTAPSVIPANTTVVSKTATTVVMSANATGAGVGNGDSICFSAFAPASAASGTEPDSVPANTVNTNTTITFPQATANWGTVTSWGLYDASTSGNLIAFDYLGAFQWLPMTATSASPSVITSPAHGYSDGDSVVVTEKYGGSLPTTGGSWAGLLTVASSTTNTFTAGVNTSSVGDGLVRKVTAQSIPQNVTASFAAAAFTVTLA